MAFSAGVPLPDRRRALAGLDTAAADYASAMYAVRTLGDDLVEAQARGAEVAERRSLHARIDHELGRAIAAATFVHDELFEAAGGGYRAGSQPAVALWKRRLQTALTVRSQHQLAEFDDPGAVPPSSVRLRSRAASGPRQAGMDFDIEPPPPPREPLI